MSSQDVTFQSCHVGLWWLTVTAELRGLAPGEGGGARGFPFSLLSSQVPLAPPQWPLPTWDLSPSIQSHLELAGWSS